ncbi:MAG: hypothetical protein ACRDFW_11675, partial [bacterium]
DISNRGSSVTLLDPDGYVSREKALAVARDQVGAQFDTAAVDAFLVAVTDPTTAGLQDRAVWIIRVSGISIDLHPPPLSSAPYQVTGVSYVYVDATSGDWISTTSEGETAPP